MMPQCHKHNNSTHKQTYTPINDANKRRVCSGQLTGCFWAAHDAPPRVRARIGIDSFFDHSAHALAPLPDPRNLICDLNSPISRRYEFLKKDFFLKTNSSSSGREGDGFLKTNEPSSGQERVNCSHFDTKIKPIA